MTDAFYRKKAKAMNLEGCNVASLKITSAEKFMLDSHIFLLAFTFL